MFGTLLFLILHSAHAHAGQFPACRNIPLNYPRLDLPSTGSCSIFHNSLEQISPVFKEARMEGDLAAATKLSKPKILASLDESLARRDQQLGCLKASPAPECTQILGDLQNNLQFHARKLRLALALAGHPETTANYDMDAIDPNLRTLDLLGGHALPQLTSDEYWKARKIRDKVLSSIDHYQGHSEDGRALEKNEFLKYCDTHHDALDCVHYNGYLQNNKIRLHTEARQGAIETIAAFPLTTFFDSVPPSPSELREKLELTRASLKTWRDQVAASTDNDALLIEYPSYMNDVLQDHPEYCASMEHRFAHTDTNSEIKKYAIGGVGSLLVSGICLYSSGAACGLGGLAVNSAAGVVSARDYQANLEHYELSRDPKLVSTKKLEKLHRDVIINFTSAGVQSLPFATEFKVVGRGLISGEATARQLLPRQYKVSEEDSLDQTGEILNQALDAP